MHVTRLLLSLVGNKIARLRPPVRPFPHKRVRLRMPAFDRVAPARTTGRKLEEISDCQFDSAECRCWQSLISSSFRPVVRASATESNAGARAYVGRAEERRRKGGVEITSTVAIFVYT